MYAVALFLEVRGALDNLDLSAFIKILAGFNLLWNVCKFFHKLTSQRLMYFTISGYVKGLSYFSCRLPKGCTSSSMLYNLYKAKLWDCLTGACEFLFFSDKVILCVSLGDLDHCFEVISTIYF